MVSAPNWGPGRLSFSLNLLTPRQLSHNFAPRATLNITRLLKSLTPPYFPPKPINSLFTLCFILLLILSLFFLLQTNPHWPPPLILRSDTLPRHLGAWTDTSITPLLQWLRLPRHLTLLHAITRISVSPRVGSHIPAKLMFT